MHRICMGTHCRGVTTKHVTLIFSIEYRVSMNNKYKNITLRKQKITCTLYASTYQVGLPIYLYDPSLKQ